MYNEPRLVPNPPAPNQAIFIDADLCTGCETCVDVCRMDVLIPSPDPGPPLVMYPEECWFCGCCGDHCPQGAIRTEHPLSHKAGWKRKQTGEYFRIGMKDPPPPNTRPPVGHKEGGTRS